MYHLCFNTATFDPTTIGGSTGIEAPCLIVSFCAENIYNWGLVHKKSVNMKTVKKG